jgi:hypothetical protein
MSISPELKQRNQDLCELCNVETPANDYTVSPKNDDTIDHQVALCDTCLDTICTLQMQYKDTGLPIWFGNEEYHKSHQSNLVRKNPDFYRPFFPDIPNNLPYIYFR